MGGIGLVCMMACAAGAEAWWNPEWTFRQRVSLASAELSEDLVDFPVTLLLDEGLFAFSRAQADGRDLRVVASDGSLLDFEMDQWSSDSAVLHVFVPKIAAGVPGQYFDLYYGNPNAVALPPASRWDSRYRMVMHLNGNLDDAARGGVAAAAEGNVTIGDVARFQGDPGFLQVAPEKIAGLGEQITVAVRFRVDGGPGVQTIASGKRFHAPQDWFNFGLKTPRIVHTNAVSRDRQAPELNPEGLSMGAWHSAIVVYDARNNTRTICIDGTVLQRDSALPGPLEIQEMRIGRGVLHFDSWQFTGAMDEVRLSDTARSDAWIRAEAACLAGGINRFLAVGAPEEFGKPKPAPPPFDLVAPPDGMVSRARKAIAVQWRPSVGATAYAICLYDAPDAPAPFAVVEAGAKTEGAIPLELVNGKTFYWSVTARSETGESHAKERRKMTFYNWNAPIAKPEQAVRPALQPVRGAWGELRGYLRKRIDKSIQRYFLETPESSPAILQVLRDRDRLPVRDPLVPWAGEFAGKYLTGGELVWRVTHDALLRATLDTFVRDLIACQEPDGYLGPFPASSRLTGGNWDVWGHYHCVLGLILHYENTAYEPALETCRRAADLLFETFGPGGPTLTCDGAGGQMNMAVCHAAMLLYEKTGVPRYLELAKYIVHDAWNEEGAGKYLDSALAGVPMHEFPQHRWEALHDYQALPELYWLTGDEKYRQAFEHIFKTGLAGDRHNTGGVTSGEGFCGSPYNLGAIETCCTVAWIAMAVDVLRMTGDSRVADEIEWSTLNSALGAVPYSGRVCAYNVPMDGTRVFGVELPWQSPKAGPDLNCCAVNAYRPMGMLAEWALMDGPEGLALNFYGPSDLRATLPSGNFIVLSQDTNYPVGNRVEIHVRMNRGESFPLRLRIPEWSKQTKVRVAGQELDAVAGAYLRIERAWQDGDRIEIAFDFSPRFWKGEQECANKTSIYRGPLLYAYDARYNELNPDDLPVMDWNSVQFEDIEWNGPIEPWALAVLKDKNGSTYRVCDFSSAGQTGNHYRSWLP